MPVYVPEIGKDLTVKLPDEVVRAIVIEVVDDDTVMTQLTRAPLSPRSVDYKKDDIVPVRRVKTDMGETWQAVSERQLQAAAARSQAKRLIEYETDDEAGGA